MAQANSSAEAVQACWALRTIVAQRLLERAAEQRRQYYDKIIKMFKAIEHDYQFWGRLNFFIDLIGANPDDYYCDFPDNPHAI